MEESLLKADIFFFVSTIAVVLLTVLLLVGLVYIVSILRTIRQISKTAKTGADTVVEGLAEAKEEMKKDGYVAATFIDIFKRLYNKSNKRKRN